jgi:glycerate 2-kinase
MPRRDDALAIWHAGLDAVRPGPLVTAALRDFPDAGRVIVVGGGKAGAAMAGAAEAALGDRVSGWVNVPAGFTERTRRIRLHAARPVGVNEPTAEGVAGCEEMLKLLAGAGPDDVALALISGGGSALLPLPVEGMSLADKLAVTRLLAASGATIGEANAVRKHLSRVKGGRLAEAFRGRRLVALILSDGVNDPLDVIASGPTAPDPTTFADALAVLAKYGLPDRVPPGVLAVLERGERETPKSLPATVENRLIGTNAVALDAARRQAESLGYAVTSLGSAVVGETCEVARDHARIARTLPPRSCLLSGGETTVTLGQSPGKGGRNMEYALAGALELRDRPDIVTLSAGTDGEDGPTDAAGAVADGGTLRRAETLGFDATSHLARHDAYPLLDATGDLIRTGLTGTNVMDVRVTLT